MQIDHFDAFGIELMEWPGALFNIKRTLKCSSYWKVLPDFRDKTLIDPIQKEGSQSPGLLVV